MSYFPEIINGLHITHNSPQDGGCVYTTNVTITASGFPFEVDDSVCLVVSILYKDSATNTWKLLSNGMNGVSITASSNVITVAGAGTPFASGDSYVVGLQYQNKGYDKVPQAIRSWNTQPNWAHKTTLPLIDESNEAAGTYRKMFSWQTYKNGSFQWSLSGGVTMTVWGSNNPAADDSSDTGWEDITTFLTGNPTEVDNSGMVFLDSNIACDKLMVKRVTSDNTNASDVFLHKAY